MVIARKVSTITRCSTCRFDILSTFAAFSGLALRPAPVSRRNGSSAISSTHRRRLTTSSKCLSEFAQQDANRADVLPNHEPLPTPGKDNDDPTPMNAAILPWYLQVQGPQRVESPLSERQKLPDLPVNPPPLLQPLLEHISINLGLDDLLLFDLRKLDPPPALGANLLMIMGTARSEKHLHVSADRFCRWLRTMHKLSPYADGLLGRNELKLKVRRKVKRARLLSSVGSSESLNADDGIRTGWVCVNVGIIEDVVNTVEEPPRSDDFVGFGGHEEGVKLVVQMFTQEKREDLDLEGLWGGALARQERKIAREAEKHEQGPQQPEEVGLMITVDKQPADSPFPFANSPSNLVQRPQLSSRSFHTSAKQRRIESADQYEHEYEYKGLDMSDLEPRIEVPDIPNIIVEETTGKQAIGLEVTGDMIALKSLFLHLQQLPVHSAISVLGRGIDDFDSTSFLKSFFERLRRVPESAKQAYHFGLVAYALCLGHSGFIKKDLLNLFYDIQYSTMNPPKWIYRVIFQVLLQPRTRPQRRLAIDQAAYDQVLSSSDLDMAMDVIEDLDLRGEQDLGYFLSLICVALSRPISETDDKIPAIRHDALWTLLRIMNRHGIHIDNPNHHLLILKSFTSSGDWDSHWRYWRGMARRRQSRSPKLYQLMFQQVARTEHQAMCVKALMDWIPEMQLEEPPVSLREHVAEAVKSCLKIADPDVRSQVLDLSNERGQWVRLWRRCDLGLSSSERAASYG